MDDKNSTLKRCCSCKQELCRSSFHKSKSKKDGLQGACKRCAGAYLKTYMSRAEMLSEDAIEKRRKAAKSGWQRYVSKDRQAYLASRKSRYRTEKKVPSIAISSRVRSMIRHSVKSGKGGRKTFEMLGYSLHELMTHLERQFTKGMGWHNMHAWHIDHILPLSSFNFERQSDAEFSRAWALTNLRPLWAEENIRKKDKIIFLI